MQDALYFRRLSTPALDWSIKDIRHALDVMRGIPEAEAKYSDQLHYATQEKRRREGRDECPCCHRPM
jgi:hypothetical protein